MAISTLLGRFLTRHGARPLPSQGTSLNHLQCGVSITHSHRSFLLPRNSEEPGSVTNGPCPSGTARVRSSEGVSEFTHSAENHRAVLGGLVTIFNVRGAPTAPSEQMCLLPAGQALGLSGYFSPPPMILYSHQDTTEHRTHYVASYLTTQRHGEYVILGNCFCF